MLLDNLNQITHFVSASLFSSKKYKRFDRIPVALSATLLVDPTTGTTYVLVFHQMLFFGNKLSHSLLCPNQMRDYGVCVNDTPTNYDSNSTHSIITESECRDTTSINMLLPMDGHLIKMYQDISK